MFYQKNIVICGHGPGAIALASSINSLLKFTSSTVTLLELRKGTVNIDMTIKWPEDVVTSLEGCVISSSARECIPKANIVILCNPSPTYCELLHEISSYVSPDLEMLLGAPGACGFDWMVRDAFQGGTSMDFIVAAVESLPFITRRDEKKNEVSVLAIKNKLHIAANKPSDNLEKYQLQKLLGIPLIKVPCLLSITLLNQNAKLHPVFMMEHFNKSSSKPRNFYDVSQDSISMVDAIDVELKCVHSKILSSTKINLGDVQSLKNWYESCYLGRGVTDTTKGLQFSLASNKILSSVQAPMTQCDKEERKTNLNSRYLTEDVPYGLMIYKGLAELVEVKVPVMDSVIIWSQEKINRRYINYDGTLDVDMRLDSGAPQRYGIKTLPQLARLYTKSRPDYSVRTSTTKSVWYEKI